MQGRMQDQASTWAAHYESGDECVTKSCWVQRVCARNTNSLSHHSTAFEEGLPPSKNTLSAKLGNLFKAIVTSSIPSTTLSAPFSIFLFSLPLRSRLWEPSPEELLKPNYVPPLFVEHISCLRTSRMWFGKWERKCWGRPKYLINILSSFGSL